MAPRYQHHHRTRDFGRVLDHAERIVRLVLSLVIVTLLLWLCWTDPVLSANSQIYLKALMAFALAVLMASMAGMLEIEGKSPGWIFRAAGGCAIFALVWFTLPAIVGSLERRAAAELRMESFELFDIRSMEPPGDPRVQAVAGVAVTVPLDISATSRFNVAQPAWVHGAMLHIRVGHDTVKLPWLYFVRHVPGKQNSWLSSDPLTTAQTFAVAAETHQYREVLFASSPQQLNWGQVIRHMEKTGTLELTVFWQTRQERGAVGIEQSCRTAVKPDRATVRAVLRRFRNPGRYVFNCAT
ncbi:hypothetical protein [Pseudoduganella buxea]|uniref:Uncharacterized protein n=1 Tax=Pseudoduganella buxea TaxID=1949069 RepID=A0A6I3SWQ1_9BURK|nr:hypothetical protein [Pseudoduganella buxea]MTV53464.1 hypothetical protein [Pseudoduganella buxea]GGB95201.1 hypothetical protein GCM10011572_16470 [Pseudoduganella buxea]